MCICLCVVVCASNCTTYGCAAIGPGKCDRCDFGFALTSTNTCAPLATSRFPDTPAFSRILSTTSTSVSDWTSAMTAWTTIDVEDITCPMLEIGLGLGVPCGCIIIVLLIIITVLCVKNRSLREYKRQSQGNGQSHVIVSSASNATLEPPLTGYQQLKTPTTQREYERIDRYDNISTTTETETTGHYETTLS